MQTRDLPVGAVYRNGTGPDLEFDPPLRIIAKLESGGMVVQEVDLRTGLPVDDPTTLDPVPSASGGWAEFQPALVALPDQPPAGDGRSEASQPTSEAGPMRWRTRAYNAMYRTRWQVGLSAGIGVSVAAITAAVDGRADFTPFGALGDYLGFALGISSILALVASITFGFLLHHMQSVIAEKHVLYARFKDGVNELRRFLDERHEAGVIDQSYDYPFGLVQSITLENFPLMDWAEVIEPTVSNITEDQREKLEELGQFGPMLRGVAYRVNDIEEIVQGLFFVFVKEVGTVRMLSPVVKAFQTLAVVILTVLVALVAYDGIIKTTLFAAAVGLAVMAMLLILQLALVARREAREVPGMSLLSR